MRAPRSPGPGCSRSQSRERTVVLTCFKSPSTSPGLGQGRSPWPLLASGLRLPAIHQAPQRRASKFKTLQVLLAPSVQLPHCLPVKPEVWILPRQSTYPVSSSASLDAGLQPQQLLAWLWIYGVYPVSLPFLWLHSVLTGATKHLPVHLHLLQFSLSSSVWQTHAFITHLLQSLRVS